MKQSSSIFALDCFAELVIGPARGPHHASAMGCPASGGTRWLAMTSQVEWRE
jgi:hypothetical protein